MLHPDSAACRIADACTVSLLNTTKIHAHHQLRQTQTMIWNAALWAALTGTHPGLPASAQQYRSPAPDNHILVLQFDRTAHLFMRPPREMETVVRLPELVAFLLTKVDKDL